MPQKHGTNNGTRSAPVNLQVIQSLPPVDESLKLFGVLQEEWSKPPNRLRKSDLWSRLERYAFPGELGRLRLSNMTISDILTALTQINISRPLNERWTQKEFIDGTGEAGLDTWNRRQNPIEIYDSDGEGTPISADLKGQQSPLTQQEFSGGQGSPGGLSSKTLYTSSEDSPLSSQEFLPSPSTPGQVPKDRIPRKETVTVDLSGENEPEQRAIDRAELNLPRSFSDDLSRQRIAETISKALHDELYIPLSRHLGSPKKSGTEFGYSVNFVNQATPHDAALDICFPMKRVFAQIEIGSPTRDPDYNPSWRFGRENIRSQSPRYKILGYGPTWSQNSCAIDSCIVAGMFLDAGSTIADRSGEIDGAKWLGTLSEVSRYFRKIVAINWSCQRLRPSRLRDILWDLLNQHQIANNDGEASGKELWQRGNMLPALSVWNAFTEGFGQFQYKFCRTTTQCPCGAARKEGAPILASDVTLDDIGQSPSMQQLLAYHFGPIETTCRQCQSQKARVNQRLVLGDLPLRLTVIPPSQRRREGGTSMSAGSAASHTANVSFSYRTTSGTKLATYRWLGGIYYRGQHFRTYWSDRSRDESDEGTFCAYDGRRVDGAIIGGFRATNPDERVHAAWGNEGQVLLFYERVVHPSPSLLQCAIMATSEMIQNFGGQGNAFAPKDDTCMSPLSTRSRSVPAEVRFASSAPIMFHSISGNPQPRSASQFQSALSHLVGSNNNYRTSALPQVSFAGNDEQQLDLIKLPGEGSTDGFFTMSNGNGMDLVAKMSTILLERLNMLGAHDYAFGSQGNSHGTAQCDLQSCLETSGAHGHSTPEPRTDITVTNLGETLVHSTASTERIDGPAQAVPISPGSGGGLNQSSQHEDIEAQIREQAQDIEDVERRNNEAIERTFEEMIKHKWDNPLQHRSPQYTQSDYAQIAQAGHKLGKPLGACWICRKEVLGTDFGFWQLDGRIFLRHSQCWSCEKCDKVIHMDASQRAATAMYKLRHKTCEEVSDDERCQICQTALTQFSLTSIEWASGGPLCPACVYPETERENGLRHDVDEELKSRSACERGVSIPYPRREDGRRSQSRAREGGLSAQHKRKRDNDNENDANAKELKQLEEQKDQLQGRRRKFEAATELIAACIKLLQ